MPFIDDRDRLWLVWVANGTVSVARSSDAGHGFGTTVEIGQHGMLLDSGTDAKPQLLVDAMGRIVVAYSVFKDTNWNAQVLISTSDDDGASFSAPRSLSHNAASQRFPALTLDSTGTLTALWLDKRTVAKNRSRGFKQAGAALALARSTDGGRSFGVERIAQDRTCECCHIAVAQDQAGRTVVVFRSIFRDRERDHAVLTIEKSGAIGHTHRVAADRWAIDACPHQGPSVAVTADGVYHVAWFTQGAARQGSYYARSADAGRTFNAPISIGNVDQQAARPALLASGNAVWLAWKEFDGERNTVWMRSSNDAGHNWSVDRKLATTAGYADHPMLVRDSKHVYVSWMTHAEGYQLITLDSP
jgi:hypothetical protein